MMVEPWARGQDDPSIFQSEFGNAAGNYDPNTKRLPYGVWLARQPKAVQEKALSKMFSRQTNNMKFKRTVQGLRRKRAALKRAGMWRSNRSYGRRRRFRGRGAYSIGGNLNFGNADSYFRGSLGGFYNSNPNNISGSGAYTVGTGSGTLAPDIPQFDTANGEYVEVAESEYLGDIAPEEGTPSPFYLDMSQSINPCNPTLFPWLSKIAQNYQEYEFTGLVFYLRTLSSDYTTNVSMGSIFGGVSYNVSQEPPANKRQLVNLDWAQSCKPSCSLMIPVECKPRLNVATHLFCAPGGDYDGSDPQWYDLGKIFIGTEGLANEPGPTAIGNIAELHVSYKVRFYKKIVRDDANLTGYTGNVWKFNGLVAGLDQNGNGTTAPTKIMGDDAWTWDALHGRFEGPPVPNSRWLVIWKYDIADISSTAAQILITGPGVTTINCDNTFTDDSYVPHSMKNYFEVTASTTESVRRYDNQINVWGLMTYPTVNSDIRPTFQIGNMNNSPASALEGSIMFIPWTLPLTLDLS